MINLNNYSPHIGGGYWWIQYPPLFTDTEGNNYLSIYQSNRIKKRKNWQRRQQKALRNFKFFPDSRAKWAAVQETSHDSSGDQQEKSNVFLVFRGKNTAGKKWLIRWSIEKISSVQSSQLLPQVSACQEDLHWPNWIADLRRVTFVVAFAMKINKLPRRYKLIFNWNPS